MMIAILLNLNQTMLSFRERRDMQLSRGNLSTRAHVGTHLQHSLCTLFALDGTIQLDRATTSPNRALAAR